MPSPNDFPHDLSYHFNSLPWCRHHSPGYESVITHPSQFPIHIRRHGASSPTCGHRNLSACLQPSYMMKQLELFMVIMTSGKSIVWVWQLAFSTLLIFNLFPAANQSSNVDAHQFCPHRKPNFHHPCSPSPAHPHPSLSPFFLCSLSRASLTSCGAGRWEEALQEYISFVKVGLSFD